MDEAQFRVFYETTRLPLRAFVLRTTGNADLADDITQDSFVRLLGSRKSLDDDDSRRRYLFTIASNLMRDHWRRAKLEPEREKDSADMLASTAHDPIGHHDMSSALASLSESQRSMVWLAYVEGLSHREIAQTMSLKEGSIRVLLSRARARLLDALTHLGMTEQ
ncbi:MAG: RNA polymerase sigma factor [bacterium]|nr:RNA polymerase sigma factor [Candidatus Kapabacteria bacterium]